MGEQERLVIDVEPHEEALQGSLEMDALEKRAKLKQSHWHKLRTKQYA